VSGRLFRAAIAVTALNAVFFIVAVAATFLPHERLAERVRQAFAAGDLGFVDYRFFDAKRGFNQYNDCAVLQMITNDSHVHVADAVGPMHYLANDNGDAQCRTLFGVVNANAGRLIPTRHARYWHGYNVCAAVLLSCFPLATVRWLLRIIVYALVVTLPVVAYRADRKTGIVASVFSVAMLSFYAMPYFEQSLTHAPGDICILATLLLLIVNANEVLFFSAIAGSFFAYFDDLIGVIPVGIAFVFIFSYLTKRKWRSGFEALAGLAVGGVIPVATKQIVSVAVLGRGATSDFAHHLAFYVSAVPARQVRAPHVIALLLDRMPVLLPFAMLANATRMLTYGSNAGAALLIASTVLAWLAAATIVWRRKEGRGDFLAFLFAGQGVFIGWILAAQTHTFEHAVFMVRLAIIPIAAGWMALAWSWGVCQRR
jgi:hypothetical protein